MIKFNVKINRQFGRQKAELIKQAKAVVRDYIDDFAIAAQSAIQEDNYYVEFGSTRTVSREVVQEGRRNIVDDGTLLESLQIVEEGNTVSAVWTADHAKAVRFGYATYNAAGERQGSRFMPGRDWIAIAQKETPLPKKRGGTSLRGVIAADSGAQYIPNRN